MTDPKDVARGNGWEMRLGDCRIGLESMVTIEEECVVITDPPWPNMPDGLYGMSESPLSVWRSVQRIWPVRMRRLILWMGCNSDPRWCAEIPDRYPFVRVCWLRYACPSYQGTILNSGTVAYVYGDASGPDGGTLLPGEVTSVSADAWNRRRIRSGKVHHPTPRKLEHADWLVRNFTKRGELILDPFAGSGTTGVACVKQGRRFIGWERVEEFYEEACTRLGQTKEQGDLFAPRRAKPKNVNLFSGGGE